MYHTFVSPFIYITNPKTDQSKTTAKSRLILKKPLSISRLHAQLWNLPIEWCLSISLHERPLLLNGLNAKLTLSKMVACLRCHSITSVDLFQIISKEHMAKMQPHWRVSSVWEVRIKWIDKSWFWCITLIFSYTWLIWLQFILCLNGNTIYSVYKKPNFWRAKYIQIL